MMLRRSLAFTLLSIDFIHRFGWMMAENLSSLSGKHVVITGLETPVFYKVVRNSTGQIVQLQGLAGIIFPWLSYHYNFTYSELQVPTAALDASGNKPGLITYLNKGECDVVISVTPTFSRAALVDFTHPALFIPISFLVSSPQSSVVDVLAVMKPFTRWVWLGILLTFIAVLFSLYFFIWDLVMFAANANIPQTQRDKLAAGRKLRKKVSFYVTKLLLNQGGNFLSTRKLPIMIVGCFWSLSALVLTIHYTTLLTSYVAAPVPKPLIKSIYELKDRPDISLVTEKNINVDALLSSAQSGFLKVLGDKLREFPQSRCNKSQECVDLVKKGTTVYISGKESYLYSAMKDDYQLTGKCNLELSKENFELLRTGWATRKKSPYLDPINQGIMRLYESGLILKWYKEVSADPRPCLRDAYQMKKQEHEMAPLTLKGLTGLFTGLIAGYLLAIVAFLGEVVSAHKYSGRCKQTNNQQC